MPSAWGVHEHKAKAGFHISPQGDILDNLGQAFSLICVGSNDEIAKNFSATSSRLGIPLNTIQSNLPEAAAMWGENAILLRPDHFIAYAGDCIGIDVPALLKKSTGR